MNKTQLRKLLSLILCIVLIAATALFTTGCSDNSDAPADGTAVVLQEDGSVLGEGDTEFAFTVVDADGNEISCTILTDEETVGAALLSLGLIAGEDSEYGLYVKSVNGITADYDADGTYWAFYENDQYAMAGVDTTAIVPGTEYSFRVEK